MNKDAKSNYRRGTVEGASPVRLVILLYEQLTDDLRGAAAAIEPEDIEARTRHLGHAHEVLGLLQGCLDRRAGQQVADNLGRFYGMLRDGLLSVQIHPDRRILEKYIAQLLSLREAWIEVERKSSPEPERIDQPAAEAAGQVEASVVQADWRA